MDQFFFHGENLTHLDTIPALGPYEYLIFRAAGIGGTNYNQIKSLPQSDLNDTVFTDTLN